MSLSSLWDEVINKLSSLQFLLHLQSIRHKPEMECAEMQENSKNNYYYVMMHTKKNIVKYNYKMNAHTQYNNIQSFFIARIELHFPKSL